jgi:hypothetical protein
MQTVYLLPHLIITILMSTPTPNVLVLAAKKETITPDEIRKQGVKINFVLKFEDDNDEGYWYAVAEDRGFVQGLFRHA